MKITDDELVGAIWRRQIKRLPVGVIHRYINDEIAVCGISEFDFNHSSDQHRVNRHLITDEIGKQQLMKRLWRLFEQKRIQSVYPRNLLTFYIDNDAARSAFAYTRDWWMDKGVPTGCANGRANTIKMARWEDKAHELKKILTELFL